MKTLGVYTKILLILLASLITSSVFADNWNESDPEGYNAFKNGDLATVKKLYGGPAPADNASLITQAVDLAVQSRNLALVKYLASEGWLAACRKLEPPWTCDAIESAASTGSVPMIQYLMSQGFDVTAGYALHEAAGFGRIDAVRFLCEQGLDARKKDRYGMTALERAKRGRGEIDAKRPNAKADYDEVVHYLTSHTCVPKAKK